MPPVGWQSIVMPMSVCVTVPFMPCLWYERLYRCPSPYQNEWWERVWLSELKTIPQILTSQWRELDNYCERVVMVIEWVAAASSHIPSVFMQFYIVRTHPFNGLCPGLPRWASTRKVKPIWILLEQETVSGSDSSWAICKSAPRSRQITMPAPHYSSFLQAECPSCHPTNSVKALKAQRHSFTLYSASNMHTGGKVCGLWLPCCHEVVRVCVKRAQIADKLFSSFGQDILDSLFWTAAEPRGRRREHVGVLPHLALAVVYVCILYCVKYLHCSEFNVILSSSSQWSASVHVSSQ